MRGGSQEFDLCFTSPTEAKYPLEIRKSRKGQVAPVNILIVFLKSNGARYNAVQDITRLVLGGQVVLVRFVLGCKECGKGCLETLNFRVRLALYLDDGVHDAENNSSKVSAERKTRQADDYLPLNQLLEDYIQCPTVCRMFSGRRT